MALYERLSATSSPEDIAAAYDEFVGLAGGDTAAVQKQAVDYLTTLGIGAPSISQAYNIYTQPQAEAPVVQSPLATVASGKSTVLEDTAPEDVVVPPKTPGALTQATTGATTATATPATIAANFAGRSYDLAADSVNKVKDQILAQGTTSKWTGEGFGSAEANAEAMAKNLVASGVTDISQVGQKTITIPGYHYETEGGTLSAPESTQTVLINKLTGEQLISDYGERTSGDAWSGTYAGKGNTAFRTTFDAQGRPIFYTTGASSSDIGSIAPILAIAQFIPGVAPFAMAANAAIAIDQGDVLGGLASLAGLSGFTDAATALRVTKAIDQGDMGALAMSLLQNDTVGKMAGSTMLTDTISLADAGNAYNVATNVAAGNYAGALNSLGTLTNSSDIKTAGAALNLANALNSGNEVAIINAAAGLNNTIKAADNLANANVAKSVATSVSSGADAFVQAKQAGATDAEALDAASTVTSTGTGTSVSTTTQTDTTTTQDLPADTAKAETARLTNEYVKSLGKTSVDQLTDAQIATFLDNYDKFTAGGTGVLKAATLQDLLSGNTTADAATSLANSTNVPKIELTNLVDSKTAADTQTEASKVDSALADLTTWANTLEGPEADTIKQLISTTAGLFGEQIADLGTAVSQTGLVGRYNALVQLGEKLEGVSKDLEIPGVTNALSNFNEKVSAAEGYGGKLAAALQAIKDQPLVVVAAAKEVGQEALPLLLGGAAYKYGGKMLGLLTDMSANSLESMGSKNRETFNEEIAKGTPPDQAEKIAERNGIIAGAITMGTAGLVDTSLIKLYENAMQKVGGRVLASSATEFPEEGIESLATALATGKSWNEALTESITGSLVGTKASGTVAAGTSGGANVDINKEVQSAFAEQGLTSTDGTFRPETIVKIGDTATGATDAAGSSLATKGGDSAITADSGAATDFASIFDSTGSITQAVDTSVSNAVSAGANVDSVVNSVVAAANTAGANVNTTAANAANAAVAAGADVTTASNAATTAVSNATTGTTTGTGTATNTNTGTDSNSNTSSNTNTGVTTNTSVDTNTNTSTTTTTNTNTNTNTTVTTNSNTGVTTTTNVNNNTGVNTNTTTDSNTGVTTNTVTDTNSGVTVNVNVDAGSGEVISVDGGTVIDKDTVVVDGTAIDINTGEILTPAEVEKRKAAVTKTAVPAKKPTAAISGPTFTEPTYAAKPSDISETWLGGRFRNIAPLAGMGILMPESTPMFQETQALSALRRAAGLEDEPKTPEADYYAYGTEPSYSKILEPFMNGGTVQNHADGGKIMASPLMAASGGDVPHKGSHYVQGAGGGQDDLIPAKLADGEYVFDAEIVAALGDGSNKEGAKKLDAMREAIRKHKRGGSLKSIPPKAKSPLAYLKGAL